ncbi:unnamed protein product [Nezara viridula]|uniref:Activating transcription factor 7-interacting protein Fn3 domain-containing protein n=1 Tax=Nezara viridula TaxID=85310 RepID=A0A9P0HBZ0_NEZVI|nr:unnamed protein product [Nezara viridula]
MPSSHLRMEEATSIIASKPISDKFVRQEIDDLDDFVLQIDENEINNEIKANGLVEDVAIDVVKQMENNEEKITKPLNTHLETEVSEKCGTNIELEEESDKKSCGLEDENESIGTAKINVLCDEQNAETESKNNSEKDLNIDKNVNAVSNKSDSENDTNKTTVEPSNDSENNGVEENKTPSMESCDITGENEELNLNESVKADSQQVKDETNEFIAENLESVDKELDTLLSMEPDISNDQPSNISEPMEVDPSPNELPVVKMITIEHSPSVALELQNHDDKMDSESDVNDHNSAPDSPTITMHSPQTLNDLDENSSSGDGFLKEKTVKGFSNICRSEGETNDTTKEEFIYHKVKHIQISAQSNILKEKIDPEKRLKREADEETSANDQIKKIKLDKGEEIKEGQKIKLDKGEEIKEGQKIKLDKGEEIKEGLTVENNLEENGGLKPIKTLKKEPVSDSGSSYDSGSSTGNDSSDESVDMNGTDPLNEMIKIKNKLVKEEYSPEELKEVMEGRKKLFSNYFEGKTEITVNRYVLEEMVMTQVIEMISYKTDVGQLRQKCRILQNEQIRLNQMVTALKRQADNARLIIKKLIDEKSNSKNWTHTAIPLKVTRSVGLQVCTCGSMTVRSKFSEKEIKPIKPETVVTKNTCNISSKTDKDSNVSKVGPFDNKENISSNVEKDASNKDSSTTDDVVIVSVTENNSTSSSAIKDKSNNSTMKKSFEAPKNGTMPTEKVVRKPLNVEYTKSPTVANKTSVVSNQKKLSTDNSLVEKESSQTLKTDVSEIIDLTDKEDHPVKKLEAASKQIPASISSEKHPTGIVEKSKKTISSQPSPLVAVNGIKKSSLPSSTATNKKSLDIAPAADLVNSYDHLPKYPVSPKYPPNIIKPPRPILRIGKNTSGKQGIMLSWSFEGGRNPPNIEEYQLFAYQESKNSEKLKTDTWKKVGDIKALPLPMACFLTQVGLVLHSFLSNP